MPTSDRFVYRGRERTVESVVRKSRQAGGSYDSYLSGDVQKYSPKEGECSVRILPPTWDTTSAWGDGWDIGIQVHHGVGPDNAAYLCLDKMKGETCPVCEARRNSVDDDEKDQLKPGIRFLCWIVDRDNEKAGPMLWSMPISLFREINARAVDKKTNAAILLDDPDEGYDVIFNRAGKGIKTKYTAVEVVRDSTPLNDDPKLQQRWLDYITEHPIPDMLNFFDAEHIEKVLFGKASSRKNRENTDEDERSSSRHSSRQQLTSSEDEDEDAELAPRNPKRGNSTSGLEEEKLLRNNRRNIRAVGDEEEDGEENGDIPFDRGSEEDDADVEQQARGRLDRLKSRGRS